jgi:hypothetical protein
MVPNSLAGTGRNIRQTTGPSGRGPGLHHTPTLGDAVMGGRPSDFPSGLSCV